MGIKKKIRVIKSYKKLLMRLFSILPVKALYRKVTTHSNKEIRVIEESTVHIKRKGKSVYSAVK